MAILGIGNPLLDISVSCDTALVDKYEIPHAEAILAEEKHMPLYQEIMGMNPEFIAGGATQNTVRIAQWMSDADQTAYMGCISNDEYAEKLKESMTSYGVKGIYQIDEATPTGTCACLIDNKERSLVANISAANNFKIDFLRENWAAVESCKFYYSAGFFLTVGPDCMVEVGKHCEEQGKECMMNLSAPFLIQFFKDQMMSVMPYTTHVFCNELEAETFSDTHEFGTKDLAEIAKKIAALPQNNGRNRRCIITHGKDPTIVADSDGTVQEFPVAPIEADKILDTNGAGDSFVGGYLAYLNKGADLEKCVNAGHFAAGTVIQNSGCAVSGTPSFS